MRSTIQVQAHLLLLGNRKSLFRRHKRCLLWTTEQALRSCGRLPARQLLTILSSWYSYPHIVSSHIEWGLHCVTHREWWRLECVTSDISPVACFCFVLLDCSCWGSLHSVVQTLKQSYGNVQVEKNWGLLPKVGTNLLIIWKSLLGGRSSSPVKPSDDSSPGKYLDGSLMRDPEPERLPCQADPEFLAEKL